MAQPKLRPASVRDASDLAPGPATAPPRLRPLTSDEIRALQRHTPRELDLAGGPIPQCWCQGCRPPLR